MARNTDRLTAREVAGNLAPGRYGDGGNLYLVVSKTGAKGWIFIYRSPNPALKSKQREMGLGPLDRVGLKAARALASEAREMLGRKLDPLDERRDQEAKDEEARKAAELESKKDTFGELAIKLIHGYVETDAKGKERRVLGWADGFRNAKHIAQWESTLREYGKPIWDKRPDEIDVDDILACIEPIWLKKQETASRVRGRIEKVLAAATVRKLRKGPNPATFNGNLRELLSKRKKLQRGHHAAIPRSDLPALWKSLSALDSVSAYALRFTILTAARSGETRGAIWGEFDFDTNTWTVPAERMKAGRKHEVPLTNEMLSILEEVRKLRRTGEVSEIVFPSLRERKPLSDMAMSMVLRGIKTEITVHGFRSTFRDWAGDETPHAREIIEHALAHVVRGVEGDYRRGNALEKRRSLMMDWEAFILDKPAENVVKLAPEARSGTR